MSERYFLKQFLLRSIVFSAVLCIWPTMSSAMPTAGDLTDVYVDYSDVTYNSTIGGRTADYYAEYFFKAEELGSSYLDAFCVDPTALASVEPISGYTLTYDLDYYGVASKIADYYFHYSGTEYVQKDFQVAIWHYLDVVSWPNDNDIYDAAKNILNATFINGGSWDNYQLQGWIAVAEHGNSQNYMIGGHHAPEPATMLLFGTGLIGLAGVSRRKLAK